MKDRLHAYFPLLTGQIWNMTNSSKLSQNVHWYLTNNDSKGTFHSRFKIRHSGVKLLMLISTVNPGLIIIMTTAPYFINATYRQKPLMNFSCVRSGSDLARVYSRVRDCALSSKHFSTARVCVEKQSRLCR